MRGNKVTEKRFYCGTSNIVLPVANKGLFPPEYQGKSRLCYYASILNSIEINSSFYKLPMAPTVERWANEVPDDFHFTFKLSKSVTHARDLLYDTEDIGRFMQVISHAGNKKGCILMQFPGSIKVSLLQRLRRLLNDLTATGMMESWHLALEFRDNSWYRDPVYQLLEEYKAGIVLHDMPKSFTPLIDMERSFIYLRFHGELGNYRGGYSDEFLSDHAFNIRDWLDEGLPVFAYFNNTMGDAIHNAISLQALMLDL